MMKKRLDTQARFADWVLREWETWRGHCTLRMTLKMFFKLK